MLDWTFKMTIAQRLVALAMYAGALVWAYRRWVRPWLGHRETKIDMALLVEKHQRIDSELVAALQFETPEAERWGSRQLETAVIDYVAEFGQGWNFMEGVPTEPLKRRGAILAVLLLIAAGWAFAFPRHASAFMQRLFLTNARYPAATKIATFTGGDTVLQAHDDGYRGPYGKPITFEVTASGVLPDAGQIQIDGLSGESWPPLVLHKTTPPPPPTTKTPRFPERLARLLESFRFHAVLNDDWTNTDSLTVIPLPIVEARLTATPPPYAKGLEKEDPAESRRLTPLLEGSRIDVQVSCTNKQLKSAAVRIVPDAPAGDSAKPPAADAAAAGENVFPLTRHSDGDAHDAWQLSGTSPFDRLTTNLRYKIIVSDVDDMTPEHAIQGSIRFRADQKPTITGEAIARFVLPTGKPRISFTADDDFAVDSARLYLKVVREGAASIGMANDAMSIVKDTDAVVEIHPFGNPVLRPQLPAKGEYTLDLAPYQLAKGDQVKVVLETVDFRGEGVPGESGLSDILVFNVTDESGIYAITSASDEEGARKIDSIKLELEKGGSKMKRPYLIGGLACVAGLGASLLSAQTGDPETLRGQNGPKRMPVNGPRVGHANLRQATRTASAERLAGPADLRRHPNHGRNIDRLVEDEMDRVVNMLVEAQSAGG